MKKKDFLVSTETISIANWVREVVWIMKYEWQTKKTNKTKKPQVSFILFTGIIE